MNSTRLRRPPRRVRVRHSGKDDAAQSQRERSVQRANVDGPLRVMRHDDPGRDATDLSGPDQMKLARNAAGIRHWPRGGSHFDETHVRA
jgi:hypothetical protein